MITVFGHVMFNPGDILILKGKTNKAKSKIKEFGDRWKILRIDKMDILIAAENDNSGKHLPDTARWFSDKEFEIVSCEN